MTETEAVLAYYERCDKFVVEYDIERRTVDALDRYVIHHIETGSFLRCVLENDLAGAVFAADDLNLTKLPAIVKFVTYTLPSRSHGSQQAVTRWLEQG